VAKLLNKLLPSSPIAGLPDHGQRPGGGKNGAVVRKHIGYGRSTPSMPRHSQKFYTAYFNPYLNYHRPCGFATVKVLARGKRKRTYPAKDYRTPYEELVSLPDWEQYLKEGITAALLDRQARRMSDTEAAQRMQRVKLALLKKCRGMK